MVRNFFINEVKDERIKVVNKKAQQFIIIHFIYEKKKGFFWDKLYMESFVILPDPIKEMKIIKIQDFEIISYEEMLSDKTTVIDFNEFNVIDLIYKVYNNYLIRLGISQNSNIYAQTINEWNKLIEDQIKGISETEIEITEE